MNERLNLKNYSVDSLRERLPQWGVEPYRAEQIAKALVRYRGATAERYAVKRRWSAKR